MNHVHLKDHVVIHEISQGILICDNTSDLGGSEKHIFRLFSSKEGLYISLPGKVKFLMCPVYYVGIALPLQFPHYRAPHHSTVAGNVNLTVLLHIVYALSSYRVVP